MAENYIVDPGDFVPYIKADLNRTIFSITGVFLILVLLKVWVDIPLSNEALLLFLPFFLITVSLKLYSRVFKEKDAKKIIQLHFISNLLQIILLTVLTYYAGGITWIVPFFYSLAIVNAFWIYPRILALLVLGWSIFLFSSLTILQYLKILPGNYIFQPEDQIFENFPYVFFTTTVALIVLFFIGFFSNTFYTLLNNKIGEFEKAKERLEKTKKILEIEIKTRTEEAEKDKGKLEREVEERTRELEERKKVVQEKVKELEKSHAVTIARELKMIKLKGKIAKFKKPRRNYEK